MNGSMLKKVGLFVFAFVTFVVLAAWWLGDENNYSTNETLQNKGVDVQDSFVATEGEGDKQTELPADPVIPGVYSNYEYGFKIRDTEGKTFEVITCPMKGDFAYNTIVEIAVTREKTPCVYSQDNAYEYEKFGLIALVDVYALDRCDNPTPDKKYPDGTETFGDERFCREVHALPSGRSLVNWKKNQELFPGVYVKNDKYFVRFTNSTILAHGSDASVEVSAIPVKNLRSNDMIYLDEKYKFSFEVPQNFFQQKTIDGDYAYTLYFTNADIQNDYRKLTRNDVQLSVQVVKGSGGMSASEEIESLKQAGFDIVGPTMRTVAGVSGTSWEGVKDEAACFKETFFEKGEVKYLITLSNDLGCEGVNLYSDVYEHILSSFTNQI